MGYGVDCDNDSYHTQKGAMDNLQQPDPSVAPDIPPAVDAGLILAGLPRLRRHGLPCPSVDEILQATGSGRTRAYEFRTALLVPYP